jgi:hypothetical protein
MPERKTVFEISADELEYRLVKQQEIHNDPCHRAVKILEAALDNVLEARGVDTSDPETVAEQMINLGIIMTENTDERTPQLNGFFVFIQKDGDLIPYAWIGAARITREGKCFCDIQWFMDNRLDETGGIKLIK